MERAAPQGTIKAILFHLDIFAIAIGLENQDGISFLGCFGTSINRRHGQLFGFGFLSRMADEGHVNVAIRGKLSKLFNGDILNVVLVKAAVGTR